MSVVCVTGEMEDLMEVVLWMGAQPQLVTKRVKPLYILLLVSRATRPSRG